MRHAHLHKGIFILLFSLALLTALAACGSAGGNGGSGDNASTGSDTAPITPAGSYDPSSYTNIPPSSPSAAMSPADNPVSAAWATDAILGQYAAYDQFADPGFADYTFDKGQFIFTTTETVTDFKFFSVSAIPGADGTTQVNADGTIPYAVDTVFYSMDQLTPDRPLLVTGTGFIGDLTVCRGVSFVDGSGVTRYFTINVGGLENASLTLDEFFPAGSAGVLAEPGKAVSYVTVNCSDGSSVHLDTENSQKVYDMLAAIQAQAVLTPSHNEAQTSDPMYTIDIYYADGSAERIYSTETGAYFYRFTYTVGNEGDQGYVGGYSSDLQTFLPTLMDSGE